MAALCRFVAMMLVAGLLCQASATIAVADDIIRGEISQQTSEADKKIDPRFRLEPAKFAYEQKPVSLVSGGVARYNVTFPSPVTTAHEANNTVHCEYFLPREEKPVPAVIVLHILGGDFNLSRLFCAALADKGVAALFLKMPYYGPRRAPGVDRRMISTDPHETVEGMTQAILDIRRATAFLAAQSEIDADRLGIFGISLGGITGSLALTAEPRLKHACFLLAGGDLGKVAWQSKELAKARQKWIDGGGDEAGFRQVLAVIDPIRYGQQVKGKRILMLNATDDEVIPKECTVSLWEAFHKPEIHWYDGGHYSVVKHLLDAMRRTSAFFAES